MNDISSCPCNLQSKHQQVSSAVPQGAPADAQQSCMPQLSTVWQAGLVPYKFCISTSVRLECPLQCKHHQVSSVVLQGAPADAQQSRMPQLSKSWQFLGPGFGTNPIRELTGP